MNSEQKDVLPASEAASRAGEWTAVGATHIRIDEGPGKLAWAEVDSMLGTDKAFANELRDRIIADHEFAREHRHANKVQS